MKTTKSTTKKNPTGYTIWEGIVAEQEVIAVVTLSSDNEKTGNMLQIWFLNKNTPPVAAASAGLDQVTVCQGCPLAGIGKARSCYVNLGQAPNNIYNTAQRGGYPFLAPKNYAKAFGGRFVRFGAYGNPSLLPIELIKLIAEHSNGWTGYFHDWLQMGKEKALEYGRYFMASTENDFKLSVAKAWGLRVFHASQEKPEGMLECLNTTHGIQCIDCRLCAGKSKPAKDIWIKPHGQGANKVGKAQ